MFTAFSPLKEIVLRICEEGNPYRFGCCYIVRHPFPEYSALILVLPSLKIGTQANAFQAARTFCVSPPFTAYCESVRRLSRSVRCLSELMSRNKHNKAQGPGQKTRMRLKAEAVPFLLPRAFALFVLKQIPHPA